MGSDGQYSSIAVPKLKHPEVPHAQVTEKVLATLKAMSKTELHETLVRSGIVTEDGELAPPYDGKSEPSPIVASE